MQIDTHIRIAQHAFGFKMKFEFFIRTTYRIPINDSQESESFKEINFQNLAVAAGNKNKYFFLNLFGFCLTSIETAN